MKILEKINNVTNLLGYTIVPTNELNNMRNELASLVDAIKIYESKEVENAERR